MKKQIDMTSGSLGDKIIWYSISLAVTGILQQLFNACDVAVVGQFAGKEAMAAVGSNAPVTALLVNLFVGISLGSNVVIAKSIGSKDNEAVEKAVHTSFLVAIIGGLFLTVMGELIAGDVIGWLKVPDDVAPLALTYLRVYLLGMPVVLLYNFQSAIFRSCGNTKTPLLALVISGITNVILNLCFVVGFHMSVEGVAIATVVSNLVSSVILFIALTHTEMVIRLDVKKLAIEPGILLEILKIGVPSGIQGMIFSFANIIIQSAVNSLGTTVMAASSAAFNLEIFAYYVMNAYNQACTTFTGQNFGAGKNDRCQNTLKLCLVQCFIATGTVCVTILLAGRILLSIFQPEAAVIDTGMIRLRYIFFGYLFSFAQEVMSGYLRGFGVSFIPAICTVVCICGVRLLWVFEYFPHHRSFTTIMQIYPISLGLTALAILIMTLIVKPAKRFGHRVV